MADFENSRILPTVRRRAQISGVIVPATCTITTLALGIASQLPTRSCLDDPAVHAGRRWRAAHARYVDLGRLRSEVERIAPGELKISLNDVFFLSISEQIDKYLEGNPRRAFPSLRSIPVDLEQLGEAGNV